MTEAILFDNDGVLVDTETLFFDTTRAAFGRLGLELTRETWARRYLSDGSSSRDIALSLGGNPQQTDKVLEERNQEFRRVLQQPPPLRPHVRETLTRLHKSARMAIVTGCGRAQLDLAHAAGDLLRFFEFIVTSDDCTRCKPHPEPYLLALKTLGLRAECCLAVEDSPRGFAAATAAGIPCVVVPTELTAGLNYPGALAVERDLSGLLRHVNLRPAFQPANRS